MSESANTTAEAIGERLRAFRTHMGVSQDRLGQLIGGTKRGVQDNENGRNAPQSKVIAGLVGLGLNANWLLTGDGPMLLSDLKVGQTAPASALDVELLEVVIEKLEAKIAAAGVRASPKKKAELAALLYDYIVETGKAEGPSVERILRLVA
ncbi:helix-turn-helix domain-containing protein [Cupriavidus taiwanensis]|uniref:helix-turn-helix domain-containing protein n=1 Tax=Cupriavidus taiwanensis TaxID=164546 RepID=UPI000E104752|nr:helix-turn-helix domain-containing protein [Cupriavidus taiwanensis]SOZ12047.1 putative tarnscriptional regulator [Cupriavidus taiwanensis]